MYGLDRMKQAEFMPVRGSQEYSEFLMRQMHGMRDALEEREQKKYRLMEAEMLESTINTMEKELYPVQGKTKPSQPNAEQTPQTKQAMSKQDYLFEVLQNMWGNSDLIEDTLQPPGIDINGKTKEGLTPLHLAVARKPTNDKADIIRLLAKHGARIDLVTTKDKQTALHIAARKGDAVAAMTLIELDADTEVEDKYGDTPLDLAMRFDNAEVADIIKYRRTRPRSPPYDNDRHRRTRSPPGDHGRHRRTRSPPGDHDRHRRTRSPPGDRGRYDDKSEKRWKEDKGFSNSNKPNYYTKPNEKKQYKNKGRYDDYDSDRDYKNKKSGSCIIL